MSATNVSHGQIVKIDSQLSGRETNLFLQAILLNELNLPIASSPLSMPHISDGLYSSSFTMPNADKVTAIVSVYTDALFTTLSTAYGPMIKEFFVIDLSNITIESKVPSDAVGFVDDGDADIGVVEE